MTDMKGSVLPYRSTGEDLVRMINEISKGRDSSQLQALFPSRTYHGTISTADELGLYDEENETLTELGKKLALSGREDRREILLGAMLDYEPYELLLTANFGHGYEEETPLDWIEKWWSSNGYGSSQTNRSEASTTFAKLVEYVGLGTYTIGRRGHASRIEWSADAQTRIDDLESAFAQRQDLAVDAETAAEPELSSSKSSAEQKAESSTIERKTPIATVEGNSHYRLSFKGGRVAELSLPPKLTKSEKDQLLGLIQLMVREEAEPKDEEDTSMD